MFRNALGAAGMNNVPPQTGGAQSLPYPNKIFIGGSDTADADFFDAGYSMVCDEPVYAYYEHHLSTAVTDENSWLTIPQGRQRAYIEPIVTDPDTVDEQGLYYESGFDSNGVGTDPESYYELEIDESASTYGEHTWWDNVNWTEITNDRSSENSVNQLQIEYAYADASPTCATASPSPMLRPATSTERLSGLRRRPPQVAQGISTMYSSSDWRTESLELSR